MYISSDGTNVWVPNFGYPGSLANTVTQINCTTREIVNTISVGNGPNGISSNGIYVWVSNYEDNSVSQIECSTGNVLTTIPVGRRPQGVSYDGTYVFVANYKDNNVTQINGSTYEIVSTISVGNGPSSISSDGTNTWVINGDDNTVSQINNATSKVVNTITVGTYPFDISSDNTSVWVTNYRDGTVSKIDSASETVVKTINVGGQPTGISSKNGYVWVVNAGNNGYVTILDLNGDLVNITNNPITSPTFDNMMGYVSSDGTYVWITDESMVIPIEINSSIPCFRIGTKILTNNGYKPIEELKKGDLVKTLLNDYKPIDIIRKRNIYHEGNPNRLKDQLYKITQTEYPEIFEDLVITGGHSILVDTLTEKQENDTKQYSEQLLITDNKYRLLTCVNEKASIYEEIGEHIIYHFALECENELTNYGVYANGLLVESCDKHHLLKL